MKEKQISLYWFSGTGNTLEAARAFAEEMPRRGVKTELRRLPCEFPAEWPKEECLGIFFPVHGFTCPPFIWKWLEKHLPHGNGAPAIGLATMGGSGAGAALEGLRRLLLEKGYRPLAARGLMMPSNCFMTDSPEKNAQLMREARLHVNDFAESIALESSEWQKGFAPPRCLHRLQAGILGAVWRWGGRRLRALPGKCEKCGLCAKICPTKNIEMTENGPSWDGKCGQCLRCINFCPHKAVTSVGKKFLYPSYRAEGSKEKDFSGEQ